MPDSPACAGGGCGSTEGQLRTGCCCVSSEPVTFPGIHAPNDMDRAAVEVSRARLEPPGIVEGVPAQGVALGDPHSPFQPSPVHGSFIWVLCSQGSAVLWIECGIFVISTPSRDLGDLYSSCQQMQHRAGLAWHHLLLVTLFLTQGEVCPSWCGWGSGSG